MDPNQERLARLIEQVVPEMPELISLQAEIQSHQQTLQSFQSRLMTHLLAKCPKEAEWLDKNAETTDPQTLEIKIKEFEGCASRHDHGFASYLNECTANDEKQLKANESCYQECLKITSDNDAKSCMKKCMNKEVDMYKLTSSNINAKLAEVSKLI